MAIDSSRARLKIAIVVPGGVDPSGTERVIPVLLWLLERLTAGGDEVHVFALGQQLSPGKWRLCGATIHNAGHRRSRIRALGDLFRERRRAPFDIVHAFWAGAPGQVAAVFALLTGTPMVVTLPGGDIAALPDIAYGARLRWRGRAATRLVLATARRIIAPSHFIAAQVEALGWRAANIPFGVALDRWPPCAPRRREGGGPLRLCHVASLNRVKDQIGLLDALAMVAADDVDFTLDIVGEDTLGGEVQRKCAALGLDRRIRFHGFLPQPQLRAVVARSDMMIINSRHEGALIVLLEAAAVGVPTVGTRVGLIADWSPEAAMSVPVGDLKGLARAIVELASNEDMRLRLAQAAHQRAIANDADDYASCLRSLYAELA